MRSISVQNAPHESNRVCLLNGIRRVVFVNIARGRGRSAAGGWRGNNGNYSSRRTRAWVGIDRGNLPNKCFGNDQAALDLGGVLLIQEITLLTLRFT